MSNFETHKTTFSTRESALVEHLRAKGLAPLFERLKLKLEGNTEVLLPTNLEVCVVMSDIILSDIPFKPDIGIVKHPRKVSLNGDPALGLLHEAHKYSPQFGCLIAGTMKDITRPDQKTREHYLISPPLLMVNQTLERIEGLLE